MCQPSGVGKEWHEQKQGLKVFLLGVCWALNNILSSVGQLQDRLTLLGRHVQPIRRRQVGVDQTHPHPAPQATHRVSPRYVQGSSGKHVNRVVA
jgi:hypothetical protein